MAGCGGGGGGGAALPTGCASYTTQLACVANSSCAWNGTACVSASPTSGFFLTVSSPIFEGQIYSSNTLTVTGRTSADATVTVNGASVAVDAIGNFSKSAVAIASNPTVITVDAYHGSTHYQVVRNVYYDNKSYCSIVYIAVDPQNGYSRAFTADPAIPGSARVIYNDLPGIVQSSVSLTPNRTTVAFVREDASGNQNIYRAPCSGAGPQTAMTATTGVHYRSLSWSHTGVNLAYASDAPGQYDIYTMPAAGGASTRITTHAARDDSPSWMSGDSGLVFASYRDTSGGAGVGTYSNLWKLTLPAGAQSLVYNPTGVGAPSCPAGAGNCSAKNPDSSSTGNIIFQFDSACQAGDGGQQPPQAICNNLYIFSSGNPVAVSTGVKYYTAPKWNESGNSVVFTDSLTNTPKIMRIPFTGIAPGTVTDTNLLGSQADQ
ncbi:MAG: hypothetical protein WCX65_15990 [bacterium]